MYSGMAGRDRDLFANYNVDDNEVSDNELCAFLEAQEEKLYARIGLTVRDIFANSSVSNNKLRAFLDAQEKKPLV